MRRSRRINHYRRLASMILCDGSVKPINSPYTPIRWAVRFANTDKALANYAGQVMRQFGHVNVYDDRICKPRTGRRAQRLRGNARYCRPCRTVRLNSHSAVERCLTAMYPWLIGAKRKLARKAIIDIRNRQKRRAA